MKRRAIFWAVLSASLPSLVAISGCRSGVEQSTGAGTPVVVSVSYPIQREVRDYQEYTGRTAAVDSVQVRARVSGYLDKINFKEGAEVKEGDVLYVIDPRPYQAVLSQAEAQVRLQEASLKLAEAEYRRTSSLLRAGQAASQEDVDKALAQRDTARASLNAAKAAVEQARLNLGFTEIRSPIAGRIGRTLITLGNLVVADQTLLTTIVSMDPMYGYFDVDEPTVLHIQQLVREGRFKSAREAGIKVPVYLGLATEDDYPHEGYIDFINNQVDPNTGTLQIRALFPNPKPAVGDRVLTPGLFARFRVVIGAPYQALLVNQRAIGTDQNIKYVYVVNDENKVERHDVELGAQQGSLQVIRKGVGPKDRVIVSGLLHVRPGLVVQPRLVEMPTAAANSPPPVSAVPQPSLSPGPHTAPNAQQKLPETGTKQ
jgi:RND family efflux transporter MFP subunit